MKVVLFISHNSPGPCPWWIECIVSDQLNFCTWLWTEIQIYVSRVLQKVQKSPIFFPQCTTAVLRLYQNYPKINAKFGYDFAPL